MTDFLKRFKTTAHDTRVDALKLKYSNEEVDRMLRTTPTAYPGRLRDPPTDQLAITPYNQNRRGRRRAAREGQGQGGQIQYVNNTVSDPNRNPNPNPILLRQPTPQTVTPMQTRPLFRIVQRLTNKANVRKRPIRNAHAATSKQCLVIMDPNRDQ